MFKKYIPSKYNKRFNKGAFSSLFNGLTLKKIYARGKTINSVFKILKKPYVLGKNKIVDEFINNGFFVKPGDDKKLFGKIRKTTGAIGISNIVMLVSNDCNYACSYCQIEENMNSEQKKFNMSLETAKRALDIFERNSQKAAKKTISITGGEPLINIKAVKYIISRAKKIPASRVIIFTNGSLVTKELADYFAKNKVLMLVSLDGPEDVHNKVRKGKDGKGTFGASVKGFNLLKQAGCKLGISAVTGVHNKNKMNRVTGFFDALAPQSVGLNFGHYLLGKKNPTVIKMEEFADMLTPFYKKMREKNIFVENISRFITPFYEERPLLNECQAQGRGFSVDSRGLFGVCKSLLVSDIISAPLARLRGAFSKEPVFKKWAKRSPFNMKQCAECSMIGVCGGGCTYDAYAVNKGDIFKIDPRLCGYTEKVLEFLVWDLFEDIKGKIGGGIYVPSKKEQERKFLKYYDGSNELQRSVGHEKDR